MFNKLAPTLAALSGIALLVLVLAAVALFPPFHAQTAPFIVYTYANFDGAGLQRGDVIAVRPFAPDLNWVHIYPLKEQKKAKG